MNGAGGKVAAIFLGAHVGGELDRIAAALKLLAERGSGKEMAARAASGEQDGAGLQATCSVALPVAAALSVSALRGKRPAIGLFRVRPRTNPMVSAMARSDEPP